MGSTDLQPLTQPAGVVNCAAYTGGVRTEVSLDAIDALLRQRDRFVWLGLYEPDETLLRRVQRQFHLHDLAIEDAYNAHQRPKLEQYENSLFIVLRTAQLTGSPGRLEFGETHVFLGSNYVVTVRHGSVMSHVGLRARCESTPQLLVKGPAYVLYALMDFVVDHYLPIVQAIEEQVQEIEEEILDGELGGESTAHIYRLKRDLLALRRAVTPLVEICNRLMRFELPLIPDDTRPYYPRRLRPRDAPERDHRRAAGAADDGARSEAVADVDRPERARETAGRLGGDDCRPDDDRGHLRDELRPHARAGVALRVRRIARHDGGRLRLFVHGVQTLRLALKNH